MARTYKGFEIHKQYVGPMGWNVTKEGRVVRTGCSSLAEAKQWINSQIEIAGLPEID